MHIKAPYLVDHAGAISRDIEIEMTDNDGSYVLTYYLPSDWLNDDARQWPVTLDPTIEEPATSSNLQDRTVSKNTTFSADVSYNTCGYSIQNGPTRFYMRYNELPTLNSADVIVKATIQFRQMNATNSAAAVEIHEVTEPWDENSITWNQQPQYNALVEDFAICKNQNAYSWDVTDLVRKWYTGENYGMVVKVNDNVESATTNNFLNFCSSEYTSNSYKPILTIMYRNTAGLEGYWDYTESSAGRAGSGYVNQHSGNLVWVHENLAFGGNRMPVTISHIYNANDASENRFGLGYGWRTNYNQSVYQWSQNSSYYIWEDADGTDHYFKQSSGSMYLDEDGLELILKTNGSGITKYSITDKYGNVSYFDEQGRLSKMMNNQATQSVITITYGSGNNNRIEKITDGANRKYTFEYANSLLSRINYYGKNVNPLTYVDFAYTNSQLTQITSEDGGVCNYTYGTNNLLASAQDVNGNKLTYTYNTQAAGLPSRVISILESNGSANGSELDIEYAHNQTTFVDVNNNIQIVQFNNFGNTVSTQDDRGRAQYTKYAVNSQEEIDSATTADETVKVNQIREVSKIQNTVGNALRDNSFEYGTTWELIDSSVTQENTTTTAYQGTHSLALTRASGGEASGVYSSEVYMAPGESFTFSAYVKTDSTAYLAIYDGTISHTSEVVDASMGWTRLQVSCTATGTAYIRARLMTEDAGTTYMDCVQLERTPTASRYSLIENGDFRYLGSPAYGWKFSSSCTSEDTRVDLDNMAAPQLNYRGLRIVGDPQSRKYAYQTVPVSGSADDTFVLCGWAKGDSAPLESLNSGTNDREFGLRAIFNYTDGSKGQFTVDFNPDADSSVSWQYASMPIVAKKAYNSITVQLLYECNVNAVLFDGIQLYKEEFSSSYAYDENGNIISVEDIQGQTTTYEYTDNDLTREILPDGTELSYTYDDYHNVKTATTNSGLVYNFTYDTYGNNTAVTIRNGTVSMTSTATYSSDGNRLLTTTDAAGNITTYDYAQNANTLNWVQYPNDSEETRTKYAYNDQYQMKASAKTIDAASGTRLYVDYAYDGDLLTSITTRSTRYSFEYGPFGLPGSVSIGDRMLAEYSYTSRYSYLNGLDYGNGDSVKYTISRQGDLTKETYEDGDTVVYEYDNNGSLATVKDSATGITSIFHYDLIDRLARYQESGDGYTASWKYTYNTNNQLTRISEDIGNYPRNTYISYDQDHRIATWKKGFARVFYSYDPYGRIGSQTTRNDNTGVDLVEESFSYFSPGSGKTSGLVSRFHTTSSGGYDVAYAYTYDKNGNILSVSDGTNTTTYAYDSADQLLRENNQAAGTTTLWTYDDAGNILTRRQYAYTTAEDPGTAIDTVNYTYGDTDWGDLLTGYDGRTITHDGIGNPLSDGIWTYTWEHGRELASMTNGTTTWDYTYNADGLRTRRTNGTSTYDYVYLDGQLMKLSVDGVDMYFAYDAEGTPLSVVYNDATHYYVTNAQGDVVGIVDYNGIPVVSYTYDAWGNLLTTTGTKANTVGKYNPLRYRGYVYDRETGLYYLQSRYYDPEMGRFINADAYTSTGQGVLSNNMFAYCGNNPVNNTDPTGHAFGAIIGGIVGGILGGISAAANGTSIIAGIITGAVTGAIVGGICDGTTWAATAVLGAMAKCAGVAAIGNVINQSINYYIDTQPSSQSQNTVTTSNANNSKQKTGQNNIQSYFEYLDSGEVIKSACATAAFVPLSVGGGSLVNTVFSGMGTTPTAAQFVSEFAIGENVSMLQTAAEYIIQIFE